ncbi:MAG: CDP-alcohol phosphatidyltransferase family protein [Chloroflexi bacterium]|nr:CDP-alcohol phosphatidyltransferase family protein [Chloroflexota bacterium]
MSKLPLWIRKTLAWSVHLFTATGAVWGFLAMRAIYEHEWKVAIAYMAVAIFVDGFDGILARWFDVKTYASGVDGALMDNIIDYFTYVVVPALFLIEAELVPAALALPCAISILLTSAYQFSQVDAKTDESNEFYFKGFPDFWNVLVVYMLVLELNPVLNFVFFVIFNILIFVPIKYIYPTRTTRLKKLTMGLSIVFGILAVTGLILYPDEPKWIWWASLLYGVYYVALSLWPKKRMA